jgi:AcrR family transcriptional regulator
MPRSSREKSIETRANIIDAAYRLFLERGYSATAMRDISQAAGVTVGAIYNHFQTKEEIWNDVLLAKHPYHEILPLIRSAQGETIADLIRSAARALVHELLKRPDLFNLMFIEIVEFKGEHIPHMVQTILPEVVPLTQLFQVKHGRLRDIPVPILVRSFIGFFFSYYITGFLMKDIPGMSIDEESLNRFVDLYLYGILDENAPGALEHQ